MKTFLSIAIATFNESRHIQKCLDAVKDIATEIVIYDAQSTDNTVAIAKKFEQVKIISGPNHPIFHINKQKAIDKCTSDWILQLDADEVVTPDLSNEIMKIISSKPAENGFWINRKNYFLGKFLTKGGVYPDPTIRLYKNGKSKLPCKSVHEQAIIEGKVGHLKSDLYHYADYSFSRYLERNNRYSTLMAAELKQKKIPITLWTHVEFFLIKPIYRFFEIYLRHRGYVDGFPGFVFAFYSALTYPAAYTKYYEISATNTDIDLSKDWN